MGERIFNFSPGPAILPVPVLEKVRDSILNYNGCGMGIMELSHRGPEFEGIIAQTEKTLRQLLDIPQDYHVLFTSSGATNQFSMVPMNLLPKGRTADYIITGAWAEKALEEAKRFGECHVAASSAEKNHTYIPQQISLSEDPAYVHFTSNNTIFGTQFQSEPKVGSAVLICDASSDLLHKKVDVKKYGMIYAGAQKNLGPAGVTLVIVRKDLLDRAPENLPVMLSYKTYADSKSLYNTPPTFPIYVVGEVLQWLVDQGGLDAMEKRNRAKAKILYDALDTSDFYEPVAEKSSRSVMNVTFRLRSKDLEKPFTNEAEKRGLNGLKGHRSVGGMRASIYNAFPQEGVVALVEFMNDFAKRHGG